MKTKDLYNKIDEYLKNQGVEKYRIDKMKLDKGNFSVTSDGELDYEYVMDVWVTKLSGFEYITHNFTINIE